MNSIICSGQLNSGKDSIADYLVKRLNFPPRDKQWKKYALAHNVKKIFCRTFGENRDFIEKWKRINESPPGFNQSIRDSLIFIGDGFRKIKGSIWVDLLLEELDKNEYNSVIADGRYINEIKAIKDRGGISILVWRPGHENNIKNDSEQQLVGFRDSFIRDNLDGYVGACYNGKVLLDFFIRNNGALDDLYKKLDKKVIPVIRQQLHI